MIENAIDPGPGVIKSANRQQLDAALAACRNSNAKLVLAKIDRLFCNASLTLKLIESARAQRRSTFGKRGRARGWLI
jgi:hypothetical protein